MSGSDDLLSDQFQIARKSLEQADESLGEISGEIETILEEALAHASVTAEYNLENGKVIAKLPVEKIAAELDQHVNPPIFVRTDSNRIIVGDVRNSCDLTEEDIEGFDTAETRRESVRTVIEAIAQSHTPAPKESVLSMLALLGLSEADTTQALEELCRKGEIYEPLAGHYQSAKRENHGHN